MPYFKDGPHALCFARRNRITRYTARDPISTQLKINYRTENPATAPCHSLPPFRTTLFRGLDQRKPNKLKIILLGKFKVYFQSAVNRETQRRIQLVFLGSDRYGTSSMYCTNRVEWDRKNGGRTEEVSGDVITSFECDADRTGSDVIMVNLWWGGGGYYFSVMVWEFICYFGPV